jgi:hypothetical protein
VQHQIGHQRLNHVSVDLDLLCHAAIVIRTILLKKSLAAGSCVWLAVPP